MRIISGRYKGRRLNLPSNFKARPTTDFAKENLFNILNNTIDWESTHALDLFGGTGSISFELVSRGCPRVVCVEKSPVNFGFIDKTRKQLAADELQLFKMDVFRFLEINNEKFDFIFADPPYDLSRLKEIPGTIIAKDLLNPDGVFVMEHSKEYDFSDLPYYTDKRIYGSVNFSIFEKVEPESP